MAAAGGKRAPLIVLLTDFGTRDWFVGVMKGVIKSHCAAADTIDLCHEIAPQDIREAEFVLRVSFEWFPQGTIFLCVVDPGVGTSRDAVIVHEPKRDHYFVGPNNGIFGFLLDAGVSTAWQLSAYHLLSGAAVSHTFHGRDIFAPAAAQLAAGAPLHQVAPEQVDLIRLPSPVFAVGEGEIQYFDRFGNAITSIGEEQKELGNAVRCSADLVMPCLRTYSDAAVGAPLAYWGSCGLLEIGVREGSAQELLHLHIGQRVRLVKR